MTRIKAALSHLLISSIIFSAISFAMMFLWYPAPYFSASGGWQGIKIAAGVDLILGPLLTFIVFDTDKSKKIIIGDLTVIALMQFIALAWGVNTIYNQRPVAVVFWEDSFYTVPALAFTNQNIQIDTLEKFGRNYPVFIYAEKPHETVKLIEIANITANEKIPPYQQVNLYKTLPPNFSAIQAQQVDIHEIIEQNSEMKADLMAILTKTKHHIDDYVYIPLFSKYQNIILLFNQQGEWVNQIVVSSKID